MTSAPYPQDPSYPTPSLPLRLNEWAAPLISVVIILGFVGLSALVMFRAVPDSSLQVATGLVEVFKILTVTIVSYYCGSTANSARKTELLANSVPAKLLPNPGAIVPAQAAETLVPCGPNDQPAGT